MKNTAPPRRIRILKFDCFIPTEKVTSGLGLKDQILINPAKLIFGYGHPYLYLNVIFYSAEVIST